MTDGHVFGSGDLSPELVRAARFGELPGGGYDPAQVQAFLENVASALEVLAVGDAEQALRAEFRRNAEIAQQVLDAGQAASEQLRRQAAEDARRILEETRDAATRLQEAVKVDIEQSRTQVEGVRAQFINDLRDLYDRIGASLYRFERAAQEGVASPSAPPAIPEQAAAPVAAPDAAPAVMSEPAPSPEPEPDPSPPEPVAVPAPEMDFAALAPRDLPEGAMPPAFQQLPDEAVVPAPAVGTGADPFAVVEDEPLAPGEPLVDMRELQGGDDAPSGFKEPEWLDQPIAAPGTFAAVDETTVTGPAPLTVAEPSDAGGSWLDGGDAAPEAPPQAEGSWLDDPAISAAAAADPEADDARAEALLAAADQLPPTGEETATIVDVPPGQLPAPPSLAADPLAAVPETASPSASPDAMAVRQLILDWISQGQSREAVEAHLRDQHGFMEPGALVDAALQSGAPPA